MSASVTRILVEAAQRPGAAEELLPLVYDELRALAASLFRNQPAGHTLQPTVLVHEAYLRLIGNPEVHWESRSHFFAVAAKAMRQILVNHAVSRNAAKRGGNWDRVNLTDVGAPSADRDVQIEALNEALQRLESLDDRQVRIVELRYFAGLAMEEIAQILGVSLSTVEKDWRMARSWLQRELAA